MNKIISQTVCIPRSNIDTDLIIPAKYLSTTSREGLGEGLFAELRRTEKNFPLNDKRNRDAKILITGENFGCGSSREHASWALRDWGIQAIIAPFFADIFYNNALKNQILPIALPKKVVEKISGKVKIDLEKQIVKLQNGETHKFEIDPYRKECLLMEIDDFDYLLKNINTIKRFFNAKK